MSPSDSLIADPSTVIPKGPNASQEPRSRRDSCRADDDNCFRALTPWIGEQSIAWAGDPPKWFRWWLIGSRHDEEFDDRGLEGIRKLLDHGDSRVLQPTFRASLRKFDRYLRYAPHTRRRRRWRRSRSGEMYIRDRVWLLWLALSGKGGESERWKT